MKQKITRKARYMILAVVLSAAAIVACTIIYMARSPEYALIKIGNDVKKSGAKGLYPHLTGQARQTFDTITSVTDNKFLGSVMSFFNKGNSVGMVKSKIKEIKWKVKDILKSKDKAIVILSFHDKDKLAGTLEMIMTRENGRWKISQFKFPKFEKITL